MDRHPYFNLLLHSDDELAAHLGEPIAERVTLHEWPLSCVQRVTTAAGRRLIYKSQAAPSVESGFYAVARSPLLVAAETLLATEQQSVLLIEWIDGQSLGKMDLGGVDLAALVMKISEEIGQIEGHPPVYQAVGGAAWSGFVDEVLSELEELMRSRRFGATPFSLLERLQGWSRGPEVLALAGRDVRLVHADLTGDNLFLAEDRPKIIDWQYPRLAPAALDKANLLLSLGVDPCPHTPPATLGCSTLCAWAGLPPARPAGARTARRSTTNR